MVGAITLDGTVLTPCILLSNKRCKKELIANGYSEPNVLTIYQKKVLYRCSNAKKIVLVYIKYILFI